jgi:GT2 family glycosyltransferase
LLDRALSSLVKAEPELTLDIVVSDNASRNRSELQEVCRRHRARLVSLSRNLGYGTAFNRGWRHARGRYVAVANPDLVFSSGSMSSLVRLLDQSPELGAVSPQLVYSDGTFQPSARRLPSLKHALAGRRSPLTRLFPKHARAREFLYAGIERAMEPVEVEAVIGTLVLFRRAALDAVGGFDERYFMYAEDLDICRRLRDAGWKVGLDPRVRVEHLYGAVRRQRPAFGDFQRLKALRRFLEGRMSGFGRGLADVGFAAYLFLLAAGWLVGLREFEYSWQHFGRRH